MDCGLSVIVLELVDSNGNNLIENGTFTAEEIRVLENNEDVGRVSEQLSSGAPNVISIVPRGSLSPTYEVILNDTTTGILEAELFITLESECCGTFFGVRSANYNDVPILNITQESEDATRIVIVL